MNQPATTDRYVSFCGIECDTWANQLIGQLQAQLQNPEVDSRWRDYFGQKFEQQEKMKHDNLFFVGAQMNNLYSFFEEIEDELACNLLWKLEQECC